MSLEQVDSAVIDRKALHRVIGRVVHSGEGLRDRSAQAVEELRPAWEGDRRNVSEVLDLFQRVTELLLGRHLLAQDEHFARVAVELVMGRVAAGALFSRRLVLIELDNPLYRNTLLIALGGR